MSLRSFFKKVQHAAEVNISNAKKGIADVTHRIVDTAEDLPFVPLLPFKGMMSSELDQRQIQHNGMLHDIATKFLREVVEKESAHFEYFEPVGGHNIIEEAASGIISAILNFIKSLKDKKASGKSLTPAEEQILGKSQAASDAVVSASKDQIESAATSKMKNFIFSWKGAVTGVIVVALILWLIMSKGSKAKA